MERAVSIRLGERPNGGMMKLREEWGPMPSCWSVYFTVDELEASLAQAKALGASVFMEPTSVPEVGTFAGIIDPLGASCLLIEMDMSNPS